MKIIPALWTRSSTNSRSIAAAVLGCVTGAVLFGAPEQESWFDRYTEYKGGLLGRRAIRPEVIVEKPGFIYADRMHYRVSVGFWNEYRKAVLNARFVPLKDELIARETSAALRALANFREGHVISAYFQRDPALDSINFNGVQVPVSLVERFVAQEAWLLKRAAVANSRAVMDAKLQEARSLPYRTPELDTDMRDELARGRQVQNVVYTRATDEKRALDLTKLSDVDLIEMQAELDAINDQRAALLLAAEQLEEALQDYASGRKLDEANADMAKVATKMPAGVAAVLAGNKSKAASIASKMVKDYLQAWGDQIDAIPDPDVMKDLGAQIQELRARETTLSQKAQGVLFAGILAGQLVNAAKQPTVAASPSTKSSKATPTKTAFESMLRQHATIYSNMVNAGKLVRHEPTPSFGDGSAAAAREEMAAAKAAAAKAAAKEAARNARSSGGGDHADPDRDRPSASPPDPPSAPDRSDPPEPPDRPDPPSGPDWGDGPSIGGPA